MDRVPGNPEAKRALLAGLDEKSLPYLAADILAVCFKHTDVQVTDGPGDGKRDLSSVTPSGKRSASQCKFHRAFDDVVGSRETDELPTALVKFGARDGYFFTTGRVSPQARREFLDNFPDFSLRLIDGTELVDLVLSSPALASAWLDGDTIGTHARRLGFVVVARNATTDTPFALERVLGDLPRVRLVAASVPTGAFAPYRAPRGPTFQESGAATAWATLVFPDGPFGLEQAKSAKRSVLEALSIAIAARPAGAAWLVRFGSGVIAPKDLGDDLKLVYLPDEPETFVVTRDGISAEHEFLVPSPSTGWTFPENVSVADGDWASWMSSNLDVWFRVHIRDTGSASPLGAWMAAEQRARLDASLFAVGPTDDRERFLSALGPSILPSLECPHGHGGLLLGWFHPDVSRGDFSFPPDGLESVMPIVRTVPEHDAAMMLVRETLARSTFKVIPRADAERIVELARVEPLVPFSTDAPEHYSAKLALTYAEVASPVALNDRSCLFVSWWQVPLPLDEARAVVAVAVREARPLNATYHQVNLAPRWEQPVAMITIRVQCPVDQTTSAILLANAPLVADTVRAIEASLRAHVPEARLASRWFWDTEIKLPPSVTLFGADGSRCEELIELGEDDEALEVAPVDNIIVRRR